PDAAECRVEALDGVEVGQVDEVVHLAGAVVALVDRGDLDRELEPHRLLHTREALRQPLPHRLGPVGLELVEARLTGNESVLEVAEPGGVREVAGAEQRDAFAAGPPGQIVQVKVAAAGTGVLRVDVQIGDEATRWHAAVCHAASPAVLVTPRGNRAWALYDYSLCATCTGNHVRSGGRRAGVRG